MRKIGLSLLLASMVAALACSSDRALAPTLGHKSQLDFPPNMFAAYTRLEDVQVGIVAMVAEVLRLVADRGRRATAQAGSEREGSRP